MAEPVEEVHISLSVQAVRKAVEALPELEREVVRLRYVLDSGEPKSLGEVAHVVGLDRKRVVDLEQRALERLAVERELQSLRLAVREEPRRRSWLDTTGRHIRGARSNG